MATFSQVKKETRKLERILDGVALCDKSEVEDVVNNYGEDLLEIEKQIKNHYKSKGVRHL